MANEWSFAIGPPGQLSRELVQARNRKLTFNLAEPSECSVELDGRDVAASEIVELETDIYAFRKPDPNTPRQILYRGRINKISDTMNETGHQMTVPSIDYRGVLKRRLLMNGLPTDGNNQVVYSTTDQCVIAWDLINKIQTQVTGGHGNLGITNGVGQTSGINRDRSYDLGSPVWELIDGLSNLIDGFDWDITPTYSGGVLGLQLDRWFPDRGNNTNEVLMFTGQGGNLASVTRQVDSSDYANAVRLTGRPREGANESTAPLPEERRIDFTGRPDWSRWDASFDEDINTQPALGERANWRILDASLIRPSYQVSLAPGFWRGQGHLWLGDRVKLIIQSGRLNVETDVRIVEISVNIDENGVEDVDMTLGYPRKSFSKKLSEIDRRLKSLERR